MGSKLLSTIAVGVFFASGVGVWSAMSEEQTKEVQGVVKDYLAKNPEAVAQALVSFQENQAKARQDSASVAIQKNKAGLEAKPDDAVLGNPKGTQVVVAFLDPFCGHCRAFHKVMDEAVEKEPQLKFIVKGIPIFGEPSLLAVKALMAARRQGLYKQASALMDQADPKQTLDDITTSFETIQGFDKSRFQKDMASDGLMKSLKGTIDLAEKIGVNATPTLVVNGRFIEGGMPYGALKELLTEKA